MNLYILRLFDDDNQTTDEPEVVLAEGERHEEALESLREYGYTWTRFDYELVDQFPYSVY